MQTWRARAAAAVLGAAVAAVAAGAGRGPADPVGVRVEHNVEAPMRDGVVLRADIYRPDAPGRFPALVQRTPYSKNPGRADAPFARLAARGYVVVVQDTRGRYMSDGVARPHDEWDDGYDTVEWAARLPYVDGRVGMFGGSYLATTQLMAAARRPPSLVAIAPFASYASRYDMVFQGGAFYLADGLAWNLGQSIDARRRRDAPGTRHDEPAGLSDHERRLLRDHWLWHVPLKTLDALELRALAPAYFAMLDHPSYNAFWEAYDIGARHGEVDVPALHLTGWYDTLVNGTIANFTGLRAGARSARARESQYLIVGPWTHARPSADTSRIGDVDFGPEAGLDAEALLVEWFDHWLRGGPRPGLLRAPVRVFVMGERRWDDLEQWPPAGVQPVEYFLRSGGRARTREGDGALRLEPPGEEPPDTFIYDPGDPVPTGPRGSYSRLPSDQRDLEMRPDVLVYTSETLAAPLEIAGPVVLHLWAASTAPDTDFTGRLVDVHPDGTARALTDGILRARYRRSRTAPALLEPGRAEAFRIELGATAHVFLPGHRIRLEVSSSNFPRFDRNPNTGGVFGEDAGLRRATQTVYHTAARPSRLVLPAVPR